MDGEETGTGGTAVNDAQGGGEQPEHKLLTQQDVDRIITDRLARNTAKIKADYADYETLKTRAA